MNIGILLYPTFGGSGVVATELGKELAKLGHKVHFITYDRPVRLSEYDKNIFYHEVTVSDYPLFEYQPYELSLTSKLVDVIKFENLDLLHVHYAIPHASAAYLAQKIVWDEERRYIPFITTLHGTDITLVGREASFEPAITFAMNHSDAITAVSEHLKEETLTYFKVRKSIDVIPNFIRLEHYHYDDTSSLREIYAKDNEKIIVHVSNFRKVKRVEDVVKVFQRIKQKMPAKMIMVGDGPERSNVESLCRQLDTCDQTIFVGKVRSPERLLSIGDLFVLTSETESFGLSALEAMACGVPVLSTNSGGQSEVNEQGFSGYLHDVGDIDGLSESAFKILDEKNHNTFKENALKQAEKFQISKVLPMYLKLYDRVIEKSK